MDSKAALFTAPLLIGILVSACSRGTDGDSSSTPTFIHATLTAAGERVPSREYWEGGEFAGRPVFSLKKGLSREAYEALGKCGYYEDVVIRDLIARPLPEIPGETSKKVIEASYGSGEGWSVSISVTMLTNDVYLVACSGKRQQE